LIANKVPMDKPAMIDAQVWYDLGCSNMDNGQYGQALMAFANASAMSPNNQLIQSALAMACCELGDSTTAVILAQALATSSPGDVNQWLLLGDIARRSGLWEQAR
jgi:cytochrome c-type biogenesis protein CcmH/NrfG